MRRMFRTTSKELTDERRKCKNELFYSYAICLTLLGKLYPEEQEVRKMQKQNGNKK
jgi:hypothetical protein